MRANVRQVDPLTRGRSPARGQTRDPPGLLRKTKSCAAAAVGLLLCALTFGGAAQADEDSAITTPGRRLTEHWCSECHPIEAGNPPFLLYAPSFRDVANDPSTTEASLVAFLTTPHPPMPDYRLTPEQISDIVTFILSLRDR
jgi:mono/diheme cytochrome c family protein